MKKLLRFQVLAALLVWTGATVGDELSNAMNGLCEKMMQCARESMQGQQIPEDMKPMVEAMLEKSCDSLRQSYGAAATRHELYKPAVACMNSLASISCAQIQQQGQAVTPECKSFEESSRDYGS